MVVGESQEKSGEEGLAPLGDGDCQRKEDWDGRGSEQQRGQAGAPGRLTEHPNADASKKAVEQVVIGTRKDARCLEGL